MNNTQHGGQIYAFARQKISYHAGAIKPSSTSAEFKTTEVLNQIEDILDFSASINPVQPKINWPLVNEITQKTLMHYPDSEQVILKQALANRFALGAEKITLTNGISSAIMSLFSAFQPDVSLLITPIYSEYMRAANLYAQKNLELQVKSIKDVQPNHYLPYLNQLSENSVVVLVNPSTPLGEYLTNENIKGFIEQLKQINCWVLIDESFLPFIGFNAELSARHLLEEYPKLVILQSLTKYYACPGLRIGAVFSAPNALQNHPWPCWPISVLDEQILLQVLADKYHDNKTQQFLKTEKPRFTKQLQNCELIDSILPSSANFLLVKTQVLAAILVKELQRFNILIRDCENFGLGQYSCRIAIRSREDNDHLIVALQQTAKLITTQNIQIQQKS